ncbi:AMP-binding protein, partial [Escherichia coli]
AYLVTDSGAKVVVTETLLAPIADAVAGSTGQIETIIVVDGSDNDAHLDFETLLAEDASDLPEVDVPEDTVAAIMYTSGTTGKPKGAMLT